MTEIETMVSVEDIHKFYLDIVNTVTLNKVSCKLKIRQCGPFDRNTLLYYKYSEKREI
ncbi:MAG: hypothetical protein OEY49_19835 [Candidatus Heimdallarchaeota archaeon]|nr:hypothetical protein [Candidatus Heimdallarchaeota archaeon]